MGTVLESNRKTNNTTLGTVLKSNRKTNNTTLNWEGRRRKRRSLGTVMSGFEEHIQLYLYNINKMNNKQYHTGNNSKI